MTTWLIYALGGGWGHLNRAIALGRQAAPQHHVRILTNSPYAPWVETQLHQIAFSPSVVSNLSLQILPTASFAETRRQVQGMIQNKNYERLIVDTFPRGLGGELVDCLPSLSSIPKILIHRDIDPTYVQAKQVGQFVEDYYDTILIPGEGDNVPFTELPQAVHTAPWVMLNAQELPPPVLPTKKPTLIVVAAGNLEEMAFWGQLMVQLQATFSEANYRCLAHTCPPGCPPQLWIQQWPGLPVLHQADVVLGGAGYNTVFECHALGKPLIAFAWPRQYDRQHLRGQQWATLVETPQAAIDAVKEILPLCQSRQPRTYVNGIGDAIATIEHTRHKP